MYAQTPPTPDPLVVSTEAVQGVCPPFLHLSMSTGWPDEHRQVFILDDPAHRSAGRRAHVHVDNILLRAGSPTARSSARTVRAPRRGSEALCNLRRSLRLSRHFEGHPSPTRMTRFPHDDRRPPEFAITRH